MSEVGEDMGRPQPATSSPCTRVALADELPGAAAAIVRAAIAVAVGPARRSLGQLESPWNWTERVTAVSR